MRVAFETLGCKVNQYETQAMEQLLRERGHTVVPSREEADAYVVNTCSVTAEAGRKSRQAVRRLRRGRPGAVVAVCGCWSQTDPAAAGDLGADLVAGSGERRAFLDLLERTVAERHPAPDTLPAASPDGTAPSAVSAVGDLRGPFELLPAGRPGGRTRALLKVEDGCENYCAYCAIPYARGPVRSAPLDAVVEQTARLVSEGVGEIVVTGIEISSWGRDLGTGQGLLDLLEAVCAAAPGVRIRLGSLEPRTVTASSCERAAALPGLCPHFHLSLQSGCDAVLRRMGRRYDTARYREAVELLRRTFRRPALTTDLITGFPGETEEEAAETLSFLEEIGFAKVHVFPYSSRPGTRAASMPGQVPKAVREERARQAARIASVSRTAFLTAHVGEVHPVLFEREEGGRSFGRAPDYMEVWADGVGMRGQVRPVRILSADGDRALYGTVEEGA